MKAPPATIGPYRILGVLGEGGMGVVYRAVHGRTGEVVALKTVRLPVASMLASIRREVYALQRLKHPGVVRIVDQGLDPGMGPWYAMELLGGASLRHRIDEWFPPALDDDAAGGGRRRLSPEVLAEVLTVFRRICAALAYVHANGLVHRDLKPENVHLAGERGVVLVDFGLASQFGARDVAMLVQNRGSLHYVAPEQITQANVDARADLYALGCMLYECLTGAPPFRGYNREILVAQHRYVVPAPMSEYIDGVPVECELLVSRLLQKKPEERLGHATDVARALAALGAEADEASEALPSAVSAYLYRAAFVGRERVVAQIEEVVQSPEPGVGCVFVAGESGVGKTRLLMEVAAHARRLRGHVIEGRCEPRAASGEDVAAGPLQLFRPFLEWVADRCREEITRFDTSLLEPYGRVLALYEPSFRHLVSTTPSAPDAAAPSQLTQARVLECLRQTLRIAVGNGRLVLALDDLQWADELSLAFLRAIVRDAERPPGLIVVGACRAEEMSPELRALTQGPGTLRIDLTRLEVVQVSALVGGLLAMEEVPEALADFMHARSDGNPFFVAEYLREAVEEGLIQRDAAGRWFLTERARGQEALQDSLHPPPSVNEVVERRLRDLATASRGALEVAAVLGREFDSELFAAAFGAPETVLLEAVEELRLRQIVEEAGDGRLRFVHDRLREVALDQIPADRARALHRAAAEALERRDAARREVDRLGHHWSRAGVHDKAARYLTLAGDRASRAFANQEALRLYSAAREHVRALLDAGAGGAWRDALDQIEERRGDVLERTGAHEEARGAYEAALADVAAGDRVWRARLQRLRARTWEALHAHAEAQLAYDAAMRELGSAPPDAWGVHAPWGDEIAVPDESRDAWWREWVQVQVERVGMYYWEGNIEAMTALVERVRDAVEAYGAPAQRARFHLAIVQNGLRQCRYRIPAETVRHARAAVEAYEETRDGDQLGYARFVYAFTLIFSGAWDEAEPAVRLALETNTRIGDVVTRLRCHTYLTTVLRFAQKRDDLRKENETYLKIANSGDMKDYQGVAHANLAWLALCDRDLETARRESACALGLWRDLAKTYVYPMQWMARLPAMAVALEGGEVEEAVEHARVLLGREQHLLPDGVMAALEGAVAAWDEGATERARDLAREALRAAEQSRFL